MSSLTAVAKKAGVSVSTASVVLNPGKKRKPVSPELAERVQAAADELGYVTNYLAQAMKRGRTNMIGMALHTGRDYDGKEMRLDNGYYASMVAGIEHAIAARGYTMLIIGSTPNALATERAVDAARQRQIDGVIAPQELLHRAVGSVPDFPAVLIECPQNVPFPVVNWDDIDGMEKIMDHLIGLGHQDFLWLGGERASTDTRGKNAPGTREAKFMQMVWDHGFYGKSCRFKFTRPKNNEPVDQDMFQSNLAYEALTAKLAKERDFTAVVCFNDTIAHGACRALQEAGLRIPDDISVTGFDDFGPAKMMVPPLTTVSHMFNEIGREAVNMLIDIIESDDEPVPSDPVVKLIPSKLTVRGSTGVAKA